MGETGVARPVGMFRTMIRSQARSRRQYRRKASQPVRRTLHDLLPRTDSSSESPAKASNAIVLNSTHQAEAAFASASLNPDPGSATLDPFGILCIRDDVGNALSLIHYCKQRLLINY